MSLRKAAEMALDALERCLFGIVSDGRLKATIQALRQALQEDALDLMVAENQRLGLYDDQGPDELLKQGWRQCAIGQRTTQYCGMVEQARLEEREACARMCDLYGMPDGTSVAALTLAKAIRARSDK